MEFINDNAFKSTLPLEHHIYVTCEEDTKYLLLVCPWPLRLHWCREYIFLRSDRKLAHHGMSILWPCNALRFFPLTSTILLDMIETKGLAGVTTERSRGQKRWTAIKCQLLNKLLLVISPHHSGAGTASNSGGKVTTIFLTFNLHFLFGYNDRAVLIVKKVIRLLTKIFLGNLRTTIIRLQTANTP